VDILEGPTHQYQRIHIHLRSSDLRHNETESMGSPLSHSIHIDVSETLKTHL